MTDTTTTGWRLSGFGDEIDADPEVQSAVLTALGASFVEVRGAWGTNVLELGPERLADLRAVLDRRGLGVSAIASPIGKVSVSLSVEHEVERLGRAIEAAQALDAPYIRLFSFYYDGDAAAVRDDVVERMRALADLAEREGVTLLHENEKEIFGDVPERILDLVEAVGSDALKLAWDNANFVQVGVKPMTEAWPVLREHVAYLQVKDAVAASGEVVPAGEGDGELAATVAAFRDAGYTGFASLEPHLADTNALGGFSGPREFGRAARAFRSLTEAAGVSLV